MTRIFIVCEGQTEEKFVKDTLAPFFHPLSLYLTPLLIPTSKGHKGGGLTYERVKNFILNKLRKDKTAFVTTFFDYYALNNDFPSFNEAQSKNDLYAKITHLEEAFLGDISQSLEEDLTYTKRFFPHIQPHEFESLLFSDIDKIVLGDAEWIDNIKLKEALQAITKEFENPELINNSKETSPSHRLESILNYKKVFHGAKIAKSIGIENIRSKCKHFQKLCQTISNLSEFKYD